KNLHNCLVLKSKLTLQLFRKSGKMKLVIVLTASLALATAANKKNDSQNELFESNENYNNNVYVQEKEVCDSIANSFDAIVNVIRQYKNDVSKTDNLKTNEISVQDTVNFGINADTFLTNVHVNGLKHFDSQNFTMVWGEDLIHVANGWKKLSVNGVFHHMNTVARYSGIFNLDIIEPKYKGETLLTKNSNVYPLMSKVGSFKFVKITVNHTSLPEVFQDDKPQFDYFVKNTLGQYVATAEANNMYNDIALQIRRVVKPYMVYRSNNISTETASPITGDLADGFRFELKNLDFDNTKNNLAKISFVQVNKTDDRFSAELELRLLDVTGQFDSVVMSPEGKSYNYKATYKTDFVKAVCYLDFVENTVRTAVHVTKPQIHFTSTDSDSAVNWSDIQKQMVPHFNAYFKRTLENAIDRNVLSLFVFAVSIAAINATCLYCSNHTGNYQEIKYEDLKTLEDFHHDNQNNNEPKDVARQIRIILKTSQKYQLYVEQAKRNLKFSDPMTLIDATEFLSNGEIEYKNVKIQGLKTTVLNEVNLDQINKNLILVTASLKKVDIIGDYNAAIPKKIESGQFYITLKDVEFKAKFLLNEFMETRPEIDSKWLTFGYQESAFSNMEVLNELSGNDQFKKPYIYYHNYLNKVIKNRLAEEMAVSFAPLVAMRLAQELKPTVLFPTKSMVIPKTNTYIASGILAKIYNTTFNDLSGTNKIQKMINYTVDNDQTSMLFYFASFDLRGHSEWALEYNNGNVYNGKASFAIDNLQTMIVVTKTNGQEQITKRLSKTTVNGLKVLLNNDNNCETIRSLAHQRIPKVMENNIQKFIDEQSELALSYQFAMIDIL
ncbi:Uncharacterized protein FWK35_00003629, partial [Aphis craccivora]